MHARPGGKGVNVARTLHALGADLLLTGLAGGVTGAGIEAALGRLVPTVLTPIAAETRRTFTVVDGGRRHRVQPGRPGGDRAGVRRLPPAV